MPNASSIAGFFLAFAPFGRHLPPARNQPVPAASAASPTELRARELERRLHEISAEIALKRERLVIETAGLAGAAAELDAYASGSPDVDTFATRAAPRAPGSPEESAALAAANRPWNEQREAFAALELKAALMADQLQRYKETGALTPTPPATVRQLKRLISTPWTLPAAAPEVPALSLDLANLQAQLGPGSRARRKPAASKLAAPPDLAAQVPPAVESRRAPIPAKPASPALYERDAGTGKAENDPVPDLIVQLSSTNPRGRALAADQLGSLGAAAAPAAAALKGALRDSDRRVRASAALALGAAAGAGASAELRRALADPDEEVRLNARAALKNLGFDFKSP